MLYVKNGRNYYSAVEAKKLASNGGLGQIHFESKPGDRRGYFEVGYVWINGEKHLFCRNQPNDETGTYYLCNEFEKLPKSEGEQLSFPFD